MFNSNMQPITNNILSYLFTNVSSIGIINSVDLERFPNQRWTDHLETRALPEGPGSVGGPMRCPWYLFS
ncbi:unnamed protein product [Staurois parvus]|uniref:Uncharacterized protein n=1 Tax=Staurois parvus TaxID=386267 RepID=A0ABN9DVJ1_9NEOB|nr:unnamed protein product [Staurois parvus]